MRAARAGTGCGRLLGPGAPGQVRGRPLAGPSAAPASCPAARSPRHSLSRAPAGFPPERWARLVPAWGSSSFSPGDPGLRQGFPRAGGKSLWAQSLRTPEGDVETLTLALRLQGYAESSWCKG